MGTLIECRIGGPEKTIGLYGSVGSGLEGRLFEKAGECECKWEELPSKDGVGGPGPIGGRIERGPLGGAMSSRFGGRRGRAMPTGGRMPMWFSALLLPEGGGGPGGGGGGRLLGGRGC